MLVTLKRLQARGSGASGPGSSRGVGGAAQPRAEPRSAAQHRQSPGQGLPARAAPVGAVGRHGRAPDSRDMPASAPGERGGPGLPHSARYKYLSVSSYLWEREQKKGSRSQVGKNCTESLCLYPTSLNMA